jgi:hypothetical protein
MIYEKRQKTIDGCVVSMIRSYTDLHAVSPSTGDIAISEDGDVFDTIWTGDATDACYIFQMVTTQMRNQVHDIVVIITTEEAKRIALAKALEVANSKDEIRETNCDYRIRNDYIFQFSSYIRGEAYYMGDGVWVI